MLLGKREVLRQKESRGGPQREIRKGRYSS